ncbi:uncharacterized protein LOC143076051 [Mytilus galloprovincialis]|uniref:uncharacterized protein LOC143076051 n=1 Tax=Mytilus galloprovincialis TaxID=29158 RepID=UPI003F7B5A22
MTDLHTRVMRSRFIIFIAGLQIVPFGIPYRFTCPEQSHWYILSKHTCTHARNYTCLLDILTLEYRQNCKGPKIIAPGSKYIWQPNFNRGECDEERYQPFIFRTEGYTNCSFMKSRCYSEGQTTFSNGSAKTDRQCYCDSNRGYVFVGSTHENYCLPSANDCSCYKNATENITKTYKTGWYNAEYTTNLPNVQSKFITDVYTVRDYDDHRYNVRRNENENASRDAFWVVLVMLFLMFIIPYPSVVFLKTIMPRFVFTLYRQYFNRSAEHPGMVNRDEEQTLDKIVSHQTMLTGTEKCVLLRYMSTLSNIEIVEFASILLKNGLIKKCAYSCIESCYNDINNPKMRSVVVKNVLKMRSDLRNVVFVMYTVDNKYKSCAIQLFTYLKNVLELRPVAVSKMDVQDRAFIQAYFEVMKKSMQKMEIENPVEYLTNVSQDLQKIMNSCNQAKEKEIKEMCDKYIVLVALNFDAVANKTNKVDPQGNLFTKIENIIAKSSCPNLSRCMLYGRKAVAMSFKGKQADGENMVIGALECAENIEPCLETVDLYYKIVLFRRAWYENNPEIELKSIAYYCNTARDMLQNMSDDLKLFWSRRFAVRLLFCYLGLGMRCRFIDGYQIRPEYVHKSEGLLELFDSSAEIRIRMFFYIAYARLFHLTGDIRKAILYNDKAKKIARKGNFSELKTINDNGEILRKSWSLSPNLLQNHSFV